VLEAIMSVVGATDWYASHVEKYRTAPNEIELVLDTYPVAFLNEAARKTGAAFYATVSSDLRHLKDVIDIEGDQWKLRDSSEGAGSLLPFTRAETINTSNNQTNLEEWLQAFHVKQSEPSQNFAVCLFQQSHQSLFGVILKQVGKEDRLVKIGNFNTNAIRVEDVPSMKVDWLVL
jgi:hypothetical protein